MNDDTSRRGSSLKYMVHSSSHPCQGCAGWGNHHTIDQSKPPHYQGRNNATQKHKYQGEERHRAWSQEKPRCDASPIPISCSLTNPSRKKVGLGQARVARQGLLIHHEHQEVLPAVLIPNSSKMIASMVSYKCYQTRHNQPRGSWYRDQSKATSSSMWGAAYRNKTCSTLTMCRTSRPSVVVEGDRMH
jgi:hypothetical protein